MQVSTLADLQAAVAAARGGERIVLAGGHYGKLKFPTGTGSAWSAPVSIVSEARRAVFSGFVATGCANLTLESLTFEQQWDDAPQRYAQPFRWTRCVNIVVRDCLFQGATATSGPATGIGYGAGKGPGFGYCQSVLFEKNELRGFYKGMNCGNCDDVTITGNDVHSMRTDGLNVVATQGILIENNHIHDFRRAPGSGDHCDMLQFWTNGSTRPSTDIVIRDNLLDRAGGDTTQSIFMRNEEVDKGRAGIEMFYRNVLIQGNTIRNNHLHGITVGEADGLSILDNVLESVGPSRLKKNVPRINVNKASLNVLVSENTIIPQA